jgi:type IV pilus assembly protein PilA
VNPDEQTQIPSAAVATLICREWRGSTETSRACNWITSCEYELALAQYRCDDTAKGWGYGMDVRVRWLRLQKPASTTMLELLVCLGVMGAMISVAAHSMHRVQTHLRVLEAVFLMAGPKTAMMEYRAVTGIWPSPNERAPFSSAHAEQESLLPTETLREGGAVDYTLSARANDLAGKVLTIRAWQGTVAGDVPVAWLCGRARAAPLIAAGEDRTTLGDDELPSPCRARN